MSKHGRVLVAMSGGIDSSIVARMLHDEGYEIIGITMKTWDYQSSGGNKKETGCCSLDSINDARAMAVNLGFPHYIIDIREEFGDHVIDNFVEEYMAGRTPNPCVLCNTHIKWEALLKRADALNCEYIATGHYAKLKQEKNRYFVAKAKDLTKDQSYVLWGLSQQCLSRTLFPLGDYLKKDIKQMARDWGYRELAEKSESYEICFVPDNDYRGFLKRKVSGLEKRVQGGNFVDVSGKVIGKHEGYPFYTIGQRRGLGIAFGEAVFVTRIDPETNTVTLGRESDLNRNGMTVYKLNLQKNEMIKDNVQVLTKVRYRHPGTSSVIRQNADQMKVHFNTWVPGIAPGQSAVFYDADDVIGGGIIMESYNL